MMLSEQYSRHSYEFSASKEKEMREEVEHLTQIFKPYLEAFLGVRINQGNFPTDLERFAFIELRDKALEVVDNFRNKFKPGDHRDPSFEEQLAELRENLQIQRLRALGAFVEKDLIKSNQGTYQEAMVKSSERTLQAVLAGDDEAVYREGERSLHFQMELQAREALGIMGVLGLDVKGEEAKLLQESIKNVMREADGPLKYIILSSEQKKRVFSEQARRLAYKMNLNYLASNSEVDKVKQEGIQVIDQKDTIKDVTFTPDDPNVLPFVALGKIATKDFSGNPVEVEFDQYGSVKSSELEQSDRLVAKNIVGIIAADQVLKYAESIGMAKNEVLELFMLATREDFKNIINIVKTMCETILGQEPVSLQEGLRTFDQLSVQEKKVFFDAIFKANSGWKVAPEDDVIFETLQELDKQGARVTVPLELIQSIFKAKSDKRVRSKALGSFMDMMKEKGWAEVAKDVFQICQGLIQLEIGEMVLDENGHIQNMYEPISQESTEVEADNTYQQMPIPA